MGIWRAIPGNLEDPASAVPLEHLQRTERRESTVTTGQAGRFRRNCELPVCPSLRPCFCARHFDVGIISFILNEYLSGRVTMETDTKPSQPAIESAANLFSVSTKLAGGAVLFTGLAYLVGWQRMQSYYSKIGASWAVSLLSPNQMILEAVPLLIPFFAFALLSLGRLLSDNGATERLERWSLVTTALGSAASLASLFLASLIGPTSACVLAYVSCIVIFVSAGLQVGELIGRFADAEMKWASRHVTLVHSVIFAGLLTGPIVIGQAQAIKDTTPKASSLATVKTSNGEQWRLISPLSGQLLLVQLGEKGNAFKLFQPSEIAAIDAIRE